MATALGKRREFRAALLDAAEQSFKEGTITRGDRMLIRAASLVPRVRQRLEAAVLEEAIEGGEMTAKDAKDAELDFGNLIDFIKQIITLILQLIPLFT